MMANFSEEIVGAANAACAELRRFEEYPCNMPSENSGSITTSSSTVTTACPWEPQPPLKSDLLPGHPVIDAIKRLLNLLPEDEVRVDEVGGLTFRHDEDRFYKLVNLSRDPQWRTYLSPMAGKLCDWIESRYGEAFASAKALPDRQTPAQPLPSQEFLDNVSSQPRKLFAFLRDNDWRASRASLENAIWSGSQENGTVQKALQRLNDELIKWANGWEVNWHRPLDNPKAEIWMKRPGQT